MNKLAYVFWNVLETLLRFIPIPSRTGWFPVGHPDSDSPVFLTGNYHLTVLRIKRALRKIDAHLLVANSRGINVWCASTGGHLTNHDVISVLKTSGVADKVSHRRVILPQLAAAGIEQKVVLEKTGWKITWGPVYAGDILEFLRSGENERRHYRSVRFPLLQRLEMAAAWAFSLSLLFIPVCLIFWREKWLGLMALIWSVSVIVFLFFPVLENLQSSRLKRLVCPFMAWAVLLIGQAAVLFILGKLTLFNQLVWGVVLSILAFLLLVDLPGSTPVLKSRFHQESSYKIAVDSDKCQADTLCSQVCPCSCLEVDYRNRTVTVAGLGRCVQCGACIVQCPSDALRFIDPEGKYINPQIIRENKLGFSGKRQISDLKFKTKVKI